MEASLSPEEFVEKLERDRKTIKIDLKKHSLEAIKRAAYYMTDDLYIILNDPKEDETNIEITFLQKNKEKSLEDLVLEFFNKILIAEEEIKALKESREIRKFFSAGVLQDIGRSLQPSSENSRIPSIQELRGRKVC